MRFPLRLLGPVLAGLLFGACGRRAEVSPAAAALAPVRIAVAPVRSDATPVLLATHGTVRAVHRATLAARVSGAVGQVPALGETVRAGDPVVRLVADEYEARAAQARAQLAQVERELARERQLQSTGAGTTDAVRTFEDRRTQALAAVRETETLLGYTVIRAPFDGIVAARHVEPGDLAAIGAPLLQLDGRDAFEIEVGLPETLGAHVSTGAALSVEIDATAFVATVRELASAADPVARTRLARLTVPAQAQVHAGQFARVFIPGPAAPVLLAPAAAIVRYGHVERVFTVDAQRRARLQLVRTGARRGDQVEILAGLEAGDRVVVTPPAALRDGQPLEFAP